MGLRMNRTRVSVGGGLRCAHEHGRGAVVSLCLYRGRLCRDLDELGLPVMQGRGHVSVDAVHIGLATLRFLCPTPRHSASFHRGATARTDASVVCSAGDVEWRSLIEWGYSAGLGGTLRCTRE